MHAANRLVSPRWVSIPLSRMAPPSELACSASKAATIGFLFGSKLKVICAIQSVAIEPPRRGVRKRLVTAFIAHLRGSVALLFHFSRIIQAKDQATAPRGAPPRAAT